MYNYHPKLAVAYIQDYVYALLWHDAMARAEPSFPLEVFAWLFQASRFLVFNLKEVTCSYILVHDVVHYMCMKANQHEVGWQV